MSVAEHVDLSGATLHLKPAIYFEVFDPCWCLVFWIIQPSLEVAQFLSMRIFPGVSKNTPHSHWKKSNTPVDSENNSQQPIPGWWYTYPSEKYESQMGVLFPTEWKNGSIIPNWMEKWEYYSQLNGKMGVLFPTEWKNGSIIPNWMEKWEYYSQLNGKMGVLFPTEWKNGSIIPNWMEKNGSIIPNRMENGSIIPNWMEKWKSCLKPPSRYCMTVLSVVICCHH